MIGRSTPSSLLKTLFLISAAVLTPLLRPALPGNTAVFDFVVAGFMGLLWIGLLLSRRVSVRLGVPMALIFLASVIAMFNSTVLPMNILTLCQELYLFMVFLTLYNVIENDRDMRIFLVAWMLTAMGEALFTLRELAGSSSIRAQGTFDNPNLAASYLGLSLFLICQPFIRFRWSVAGIYLLIVAGGTFATKSLSAMLAATVSTALVTFFYLLKSRESRKGYLAFGLVTVLIVIAVIAPWFMDVHNFLDRLPKSTDERSVIWRTGMETFLSNPLGVGIGPGGFGEAGFVSGGYWGVGRRISLHSDYLSFLVERGVFGLAGLIFLLLSVGAIVVRCIKSSRTDAELFWACGLSAMFLFVLIDAVSHEVMHYRHVWLAFALIATQSKLWSRRPAAEMSPPWKTAAGSYRPLLNPAVPRFGRTAR